MKGYLKLLIDADTFGDSMAITNSDLEAADQEKQAVEAAQAA